MSGNWEDRIWQNGSKISGFWPWLDGSLIFNFLNQICVELFPKIASFSKKFLSIIRHFFIFSNFLWMSRLTFFKAHFLLFPPFTPFPLFFHSYNFLLLLKTVSIFCCSSILYFSIIRLYPWTCFSTIITSV